MATSGILDGEPQDLTLELFFHVM